MSTPTPTAPFEQGQAVVGPRCPSARCPSTDVYFVRLDEDPQVGWFRCDTIGCNRCDDFDAFLAGVRARPTSAPTAAPSRNSYESMVINRARQALADHQAIDLGKATSVDFMSSANHLAYALESLLAIVADLQAVADHAQATGGTR